MISGLQTLYVTVGKLFVTTYTVKNDDGSSVTMSMSGMPPNSTFNVATGVFVWSPATAEPVTNLRFIYTHILLCSLALATLFNHLHNFFPNYIIS